MYSAMLFVLIKNNYNVKRKLLKYFADCLKCGNFAFAYHKMVE